MDENFDLRVRAAQPDGRYPIEASSPAGESEGGILQPSPLAGGMAARLDELAALFASPEEVKGLGRELRDWLFPEKIWLLYRLSREQATAAGKRLRLRLQIDPPELARLPWEYAYDETFHYLALDRESPMVRYLREPFAADPLGVPAPVRVLVALASPVGLPPLAMEEEVARIRTALAGLGDRVALELLPHATLAGLHTALAGTHIFHFIGHGLPATTGPGALALEDEAGNVAPLDADALRVLLQAQGIRVAVLNACQTALPGEGEALMAVAPALVRARIPAVIAMQFAVPDRTALTFARHLYGALAAGQPLDRAVTEMRVGAYTEGEDRLYWGIPVLFMRAPDGRIWQKGAAEKEATVSEKEEEGRGERGGVTISGISNSAISIGGSIAGGDIISVAPPPAASGPLAALRALRPQVDALLAQLDPGEAEDAREALDEAARLLALPQPDERRVNRRLQTVAEIIEAASAPLAAKLRRL